MKKISFSDPKELMERFSENRLKRISSDIIQAYRDRNWSYLKKAARNLDLDPSEYHERPARLFKELILYFHPDRRRLHHQSILRHYRENNRQAIEKLARSIDWSLSAPSKDKTSDGPVFTSEDFSEEYRYDRQEGMHFYADDTIREQEVEYYEFIEAVKDLMYGNLFREFLPQDLVRLEGELILAEEGIQDLSGLEYCTNLSSLNLSDNHITNIFEISRLDNLEELDLSFNEIRDIDALTGLPVLRNLDLSFNQIEDIAPLLQLPALEYVNLSGNPLVRDEKWKALMEHCLVIF